LNIVTLRDSRQSREEAQDFTPACLGSAFFLEAEGNKALGLENGTAGKLLWLFFDKNILMMIRLSFVFLKI
jgi:hypothetical protein